MKRDLEYENNNIGYDWQYTEEDGGGIKCKNYELCEDVLPKWWFECKGHYLCTNCDMMFGTWKNGKGELNFSDNILPSGEYSLYTIPGKDKWKVVINSENGYFGIVQPDESNDLFSFEAFPTNLSESVEQLTIDFVSDSIGSSVRLRWDLTEVLMPFK